ncbi:hypothetical protein GCM10017687_05480 [Streptomyces echinatus]
METDKASVQHKSSRRTESPPGRPGGAPTKGRAPTSINKTEPTTFQGRQWLSGGADPRAVGQPALSDPHGRPPGTGTTPGAGATGARRTGAGRLSDARHGPDFPRRGRYTVRRGTPALESLRQHDPALMAAALLPCHQSRHATLTARVRRAHTAHGRRQMEGTHAVVPLPRVFGAGTHPGGLEGAARSAREQLL